MDIASYRYLNENMHVHVYNCSTFILYLLYQLWDLFLVTPVYAGDCVETKQNIHHIIYVKTSVLQFVS